MTWMAHQNRRGPLGDDDQQPDQGRLWLDLAVYARGLTKKFGNRTVVNGIDLDLPRGQLTALIGNNGSGKTTTMAMLLGLVRPTAGKIQVLGRPIDQLPRQGLGGLINTPTFYPNLSGRRNLEILAALGGLPSSSVTQSLQQVRLTDDVAEQKVGAYSEGRRQRLGLAAALLAKTDLLLLDEPSNSLDPEGRALLWELLQERVEEGVTVIVSTHHLDEMDEIYDYVVMMRDGKARQKSSEELSRPKIVFETEGDRAGELGAFVRQRGFTATVDRSRVTVAGGREHSGGLNRDAVQAGFVVHELRVEQTSLATAYAEYFAPDPAPVGEQGDGTPVTGRGNGDRPETTTRKKMKKTKKTRKWRMRGRPTRGGDSSR